MYKSISNFIKTLPAIGTILLLTFLPNSWACSCTEGYHVVSVDFGKEELVLFSLGVFLLVLLPIGLLLVSPKNQKIRHFWYYIISLITSITLSYLYVLTTRQLTILSNMHGIMLVSIAITILCSLPIAFVIRTYLKYRNHKSLLHTQTS